MGDLHPKYIVQDGKIYIGKVKFHKNLSRSESPINGGGMYNIDLEKKTIKFFGASSDFGRPDIEDIRACVATKEIYAGMRQLKDFMVIIDEYN